MFGSSLGPNGGPQLPGNFTNEAYDKYLNAQTNALNQQTANSSFGFNLGTMNSVMGGLNSLGQLWGARQGMKLAKDQWKTQKSVLNTNMMNQIQSYNNSLKDRLDTRAHMEGRDQASADAQYNERKARRHS